VCFLTVVPGMAGLEEMAGAGTLTLRDAQHEYRVRRSERAARGRRYPPAPSLPEEA